MGKRELSEMREKITALIDDIKYQSDNLTDLERLPVIQLKVLLAKINSLIEQTSVLTHYVEIQGKLSQKTYKKVASPVVDVPETKTVLSEELPEVVEEEVVKKDEPQAVEEKSTPSKGENIEEKLKKIVVTDLSSAIGINEKYLFASELFGGNTETLSNVIKKINEITDLNTLNAFLDELSNTHNWDRENETVVNFIELTSRKFDQP